jgi:hypothetical protein
VPRALARSRPILVAIPLALFCLAGFAVSGCGGDDDSSVPPTAPATPIAFLTPPVPSETAGISEFLPECDAAIIRAARDEADLRDALFACQTAMQWAGAVTRYPAALSDPASGSLFIELAQLCFETSFEEFARSKLCQEVVSRPTATP